MNFEDERYVRLYTRDTHTWLCLSWEARAVFTFLLRKVDRAGILELGAHDPVKVITVLTGVPLDVVRSCYQSLLDEGVIEHNPALRLLVIPRFMEAQEAASSDAQRARASREKRLALAKLRGTAVTNRDSETTPVTNRDEPPGPDASVPPDRTKPPVTNRDEPPGQPVTNRDADDRSRDQPPGVTSLLAELELSDPSLAVLAELRARGAPLPPSADSPASRDSAPTDPSERVTPESYQPSPDAYDRARDLGLGERAIRKCITDLKRKVRDTRTRAALDKTFLGFAKSAAKFKNDRKNGNGELPHATPGGHRTGATAAPREGTSGAPGATDDFSRYDDPELLAGSVIQPRKHRPATG